jgi:hypothetical protein
MAALNQTNIHRPTKRLSSKYAFTRYTVLFSDNIAKRYQPIVYSHKCLSRTPEAVYYTILSKEEETKELCIQYFSFGDILLSYKKLYKLL